MHSSYFVRFRPSSEGRESRRGLPGARPPNRRAEKLLEPNHPSAAGALNKDRTYDITEYQKTDVGGCNCVQVGCVGGARAIWHFHPREGMRGHPPADTEPEPEPEREETGRLTEAAVSPSCRMQKEQAFGGAGRVWTNVKLGHWHTGSIDLPVPVSQAHCRPAKRGGRH